MIYITYISKAFPVLFTQYILFQIIKTAVSPSIREILKQRAAMKPCPCLLSALWVTAHCHL